MVKYFKLRTPPKGSLLTWIDNSPGSIILNNEFFQSLPPSGTVYEEISLIQNSSDINNLAELILAGSSSLNTQSDINTNNFLIINSNSTLAFDSTFVNLQNILIEESITGSINIIKDSSTNLIVDMGLDLETVNDTDNLGGKVLVELIDLLNQSLLLSSPTLQQELTTLLTNNSDLNTSVNKLINELTLLNSNALTSFLEELGFNGDMITSFVINNSLLSNHFIEYLSTLSLNHNVNQTSQNIIEYFNFLNLPINSDIIVSLSTILNDYIVLEQNADLLIQEELVLPSLFEESISLSVLNNMRIFANRVTFKITVGKYNVLVKNFTRPVNYKKVKIIKKTYNKK